jgi:DNA repair protein REV1
VKSDLFSALPSGDPACSTCNVSESKSLNVARAEKRSPNDGGADDPENPRTFLPPESSQKWIEQFRVSSCLILNVIAEQHTDLSCPIVELSGYFSHQIKQ